MQLIDKFLYFYLYYVGDFVRKKRTIPTTDSDLYPYGPQSLTFPAGSENGTSVCLTISAIEDTIIEVTEEFLISLDVTDERDTITGPAEHELSIIDNDGKIMIRL